MRISQPQSTFCPPLQTVAEAKHLIASELDVGLIAHSLQVNEGPGDVNRKIQSGNKEHGERHQKGMGAGNAETCQDAF